jgi:hypothetical protein
MIRRSEIPVAGCERIRTNREPPFIVAKIGHVPFPTSLHLCDGAITFLAEDVCHEILTA